MPLRNPTFLQKFSFSFLFSVSISLFCVTFLADKVILSAIIVFGQAHFLISYIYTYKAKKVDSVYLTTLATLVFVVIGMLCFFILLHRNFQPWLTLFTAVIFVLHYLNDELKIQGSRTLDYALAILIFSCVLSYSAAFVSKLFPAAGHAPLILCLLSLTCFILFAYYILRHGRTEKIFLSIFLFGNVVIPLLITFSEHISAQQLLGFIVLFHYTRWYIHYFQKFSGKSLITYWDIVLGSHVLILLLFFLFITMPQATTLLFIFFSPIFFYGWTIIHILLSIRKSDYTAKV